MSKVLVPCDRCNKLFSKPTKKLTKVNFCCRACMDSFNSERFHNYNETENPMNNKGRTIEQRFAMRDRRKNANDRVGKECHTYNKQLGEVEHRKIMRMKLGRELTSDEVVHHIDGNPLNNKPSNLMIMSRSEHTRLHIRNYWDRRRSGKE